MSFTCNKKKLDSEVTCKLILVYDFVELYLYKEILEGFETFPFRLNSKSFKSVSLKRLGQIGQNFEQGFDKVTRVEVESSRLLFHLMNKKN